MQGKGKPVENTDRIRLGALLLEGNLIREDELERCLELQALTGGARPLGQILIEQDVISRKDLEGILELQRRRNQSDRAPIQLPGSEVSGLLAAAASAGATELILSEGKAPMMRLNGRLRPLARPPVQSPEMWQFLLDNMDADVLDRLAELRYVSKEYWDDTIGYGRITAFRHFDGACAVVRLHPSEIRPVAESGIPTEITSCLSAERGLILVTGQRGSGITSTMASMMGELVDGDPKLIVVLDENQEYETDYGNADVIFRRVGRDTRNYETGLEAAILENPDVLVVGDVSTLRSFDLALRAAEGGCLVIAALNAYNIQAALERAINFYPHYDMQRIRNTMSSVLSAVLRLALVPAADGRGHVMASELLILDSSSRKVLREGCIDRLGHLLVMDNNGHGYSMDGCLERLVAEGRIKVEDGFNCADDKARFLKRTESSELVGNRDG